MNQVKPILDLKTHALRAKTCMEYIPANVSGVVFSFAQWMRYACDLKMDTKQRNEHAITKAFLIGLNSMYSQTELTIDYSCILDGIDTILAQKDDIQE